MDQNITMGPELFVSDLDGTLLDKTARIPKKSREILNRLAGRGVLFTVATARTPLSAVPILCGLDLRLPAVLLNGGMLYDMKSHRILEVVGFRPEQAERLAKAEERMEVHGLLLTVRGGRISLNLGPKTDTSGLWDRYFDWKRVCEIGSVEPEILRRGAGALKSECIVYGLYMDDRPKRLAGMAQMLRGEPGLCLDFYKDVYTENRWCLEITSGDTSKKRGVMELRRRCGAGRVIGFGDGENDLPLFSACDEAYVVANGREILKAAADGVIGSNLENGVAVYMEERCKKYAEDTCGKPLSVKHGGEGETI